MEGTPWQFDSPAEQTQVLGYAPRRRYALPRSVHRLLIVVLVGGILMILAGLANLWAAYDAFGRASLIADLSHGSEGGIGAKPGNPLFIPAPNRMALVTMLLATALVVLSAVRLVVQVMRMWNDPALMRRVLRRDAWMSLIAMFVCVLTFTFFINHLRQIYYDPLGFGRVVPTEIDWLNGSMIGAAIATLVAAGCGIRCSRRLEEL